MTKIYIYTTVNAQIIRVVITGGFFAYIEAAFHKIFISMIKDNNNFWNVIHDKKLSLHVFSIRVTCTVFC